MARKRVSRARAVEGIILGPGGELALPAAVNAADAGDEHVDAHEVARLRAEAVAALRRLGRYVARSGGVRAMVDALIEAVPAYDGLDVVEFAEGLYTLDAGGEYRQRVGRVSIVLERDGYSDAVKAARVEE